MLPKDAATYIRSNHTTKLSHQTSKLLNGHIRTQCTITKRLCYTTKTVIKRLTSQYVNDKH
jgi:hypothetical protein